MSESIHPRQAKAIRLGVYDAQKPGAVVASDMQRAAKPAQKPKKPKVQKEADKDKPAKK